MIRLMIGRDLKSLYIPPKTAARRNVLNSRAYEPLLIPPTP